MTTATNPATSKALTKTALRKLLPKGATFTSTYIGPNLHGIVPHGMPVQRKVLSNNPRELVSFYVTGPETLRGSQSGLQWEFCSAVIDNEGTIKLYNVGTGNPEPFLTIADIALPSV